MLNGIIMQFAQVTVPALKVGMHLLRQTKGRHADPSLSARLLKKVLYSTPICYIAHCMPYTAIFYKFVALLSGITLLLVCCADGHMPSGPEPHLKRRIVREEQIQPFCVPSWRLLVTSSCVHLHTPRSQVSTGKTRRASPSLLTVCRNSQ